MVDTKFYVFYNDGHYSDGDVGLIDFDTMEQACEFITKRIIFEPTNTLENYTIIKGQKVSLSVVEVVTKVVGII